MTPDEFRYLRDMLKDRSGLIITEEKQYLLESRLMPLARKQGMQSLSELVVDLRAADGEPLRKDVTEAMTINESFFFRDKSPFENFEKIMAPALIEARKVAKKMRVWCAAASTGQESYSLAMQIREMETQLGSWNIEIFGTDLSAEVLEKAKAGLYSQFEVQRGLPIQMLVKNFKQSGSLWQIDSAIRSMVRFQQYNLLEDYRAFGIFDIVFCRNVLIYFEPERKRDILDRIAKQLAPDGYLVLGAAETVIGITDEFEPITSARGLYRRRGAECAATPAAAARGMAKPAVPSVATAPGITAPATAAAPGRAGTQKAAPASVATAQATVQSASVTAGGMTKTGIAPASTPGTSATAASTTSSLTPAQAVTTAPASTPASVAAVRPAAAQSAPLAAAGGVAKPAISPPSALGTSAPGVGTVSR